MLLDFVMLREMEQAVDSHCRPVYGADVLRVPLELALCASTVQPGPAIFVFLGLRWYGCVMLWCDGCLYVHHSLAACVEIHVWWWQRWQPWSHLRWGALCKAMCYLHHRKWAAHLSPRVCTGKGKGLSYLSVCASEDLLNLLGTSLSWELWCSCGVKDIHQE